MTNIENMKKYINILTENKTEEHYDTVEDYFDAFDISYDYLGLEVIEVEGYKDGYIFVIEQDNEIIDVEDDEKDDPIFQIVIAADGKAYYAEHDGMDFWFSLDNAISSMKTFIS